MGSRVVWAAGLAAVAVLALIALAIARDGGSDEPAPLPEARGVGAVDVARDFGIFEITRSWSATSADFDDDGWEDLLVVRHKRGMALWRNEEGERFRRMNRELLVDFERSRDRHDCAFGDVDGDGRLDFFCTVGGFKGTRPNPSELWMQQDDGTFVESARRFGVADPYGRGRFTTFLDANGDQHPDLFIANQFPREDGVETSNRLFVNEGGEGFREAPELGLHLEIGGDSVEAVDLEGDGFDDLLICGKDELGVHLFANRGGEGFEDVSERIDGGRRCRVAHLADFDGDGSLELVRLTNRMLAIHADDGEQLARAYEHRVGAGRRLAIGDATGNGLPDVYILRTGPERNLPDEILINRSEDGELRFERLEPPTDPRGIGDAVATVDHTGDDRVAFVVLNGSEKAFGPVQLIVVEE